MGIGTLGHTATYDVSDIGITGSAPLTTNVILAHDITDFDKIEYRSDVAANSGHNSCTLTIKLQMTYDTANDGNETWIDLATVLAITTGASTADASIIRDGSTQLGVKHRLNCVITHASTSVPTEAYSGTITVVYAT